MNDACFILTERITRCPSRDKKFPEAYYFKTNSRLEHTQWHLTPIGVIVSGRDDAALKSMILPQYATSFSFQ